MKKYLFLTNIPAPYRVSFYNELHRRGLNFEVYYMRSTEGDRSWSFDASDLQHPFIVDHGFYRMIGRFHVHFNPRLILKILKEKDAEIVIAAGWNDIDVLLLATLRRLGLLKNQLHFWSEANYLTIGARNDHALKRCVRKFVYNSSSGVQMRSGKMTELTMERWGIRDKTFIPLPNTIEEERFQISEKEIALRSTNPVPTFLMPVRLSEQIKGIVNFFRCIEDVNTRRAHFLIAGDGPDENLIRQFIRSRGLEAHIEILGFCDTDRLASLYKMARVFVLPSYSDASPLTLVEALRMRLPVLVSERCGNHFEAVSPGENGYLFDPSVPGSVKRAFEALMQRRSDWPAMGDVSGDVYRAVFDRETVIRNFMQALGALSVVS